MRALFMLAISAAALAASPALAQSAPEARVAATLNDPYVQDRISGTMSEIVSSFLDLRIGGIERAIDPWSRAHPNDRLRDRVDPYLEDDVELEARRATRAMGAMADEFAILAPELRASAARIGRSIDRAADRYDDRLGDRLDD